MASNPNKTDVFQFMSVRSPKSLEKAKLRHFYIQDDYISQDVQLIPSKKLRKIFSSKIIGVRVKLTRKFTLTPFICDPIYLAIFALTVEKVRSAPWRPG